ncbi:hypothetical protein PIB30_108335, partial [Stylosanthes scabra]|nr:hypothetical protein [Stylosanthes scabra]
MSRLSLGLLHGFKRDPQPSPTHATFGLPHMVSQTWLLLTLRLGHFLACHAKTWLKRDVLPTQMRSTNLHPRLGH